MSSALGVFNFTLQEPPLRMRRAILCPTLLDLFTSVSLLLQAELGEGSVLD